MNASEEATEAIERVFTRITMPPGQITLLKALREGGCLSLDELAHLIRDDDRESMRWVIIAFQNRINNTDGFKASKPGIHAVLAVENINGVPHYSLRPEAEKAIDDLPTLVAAMTLPPETIHKRWPDGGRKGLDCNKPIAV